MRNLHSILYSIGLRVMKYPRLLYHNLKSKNIRDKEISLFCNNCFGAQILHDMEMRFNSPCVNLAFDFNDYVEFLSNLKYYLNLDIEEVKCNDCSYPVGKFVGTDVKIKFMHYETFEDGRNKWYLRRNRIIRGKEFILAELKEMPSSDLLDRFMLLPYKKAIIVPEGSPLKYQYPDITHEAPYFKDFYWGKALSWSSAFSLKRNTDHFDYVKFFNS